MANTIWQWIGDETFLLTVVADVPVAVLILITALCIAVLSKGADWMIDGAVSLAQRTGMRKIVIGATIISLGTTTPEAFVSVMAAWMGNPGLALGNGVGSIIADTGLIFGLTCTVAVVPVNRFILNRTGWVQVGAATLLVAIAVLMRLTQPGQPVLGRPVGLIFLVLLVGYLYFTYRWARQAHRLGVAAEDEPTTAMVSLPLSWVMIVGGLALVILAARILVPVASEIAVRFGVPEDVIAATMVAFGTSLPELMTAIAAVRKNHPEIALGNVVGADVLNCLFVIGAAASAKPLAVPPNFFVLHFPAMLIIVWSFRFFISINQHRFRRWQGLWLLGLYVAYVVVQYAMPGR